VEAGENVDRNEPLWLALAVASTCAAAIHFSVADEHFREYWLFGAFFIAGGAVQMVWAMAALVQPSRSLCFAAAVINAPTVALWALSRTSGLPIGPEAGSAEPVALLDVVATTCEVGLLAGVLALRRLEASSVARA
jgi:hypothetical protein